MGEQFAHARSMNDVVSDICHFVRHSPFNGRDSPVLCDETAENGFLNCLWQSMCRGLRSLLHDTGWPGKCLSAVIGVEHSEASETEV